MIGRMLSAGLDTNPIIVDYSYDMPKYLKEQYLGIFVKYTGNNPKNKAVPIPFTSSRRIFTSNRWHLLQTRQKLSTGIKHITTMVKKLSGDIRLQSRLSPKMVHFILQMTA